MTPDELRPVPAGAVLVHVGPPKTGTTSLQQALAQQRAEIGRHGALYPGRFQRHRREGDALLGRVRTDGKPVPSSAWDDLVAEVAAAPDSRVCISTENLARARPQHIRRVVTELGSERVHLVVVARRLDRLLPSAWQQRVKGVAETLPYGEWLGEVLADPPASDVARTFWHHHDLARTLAQWGEHLPAERLVVVVGDEADRSALMRTFERLLALPADLLVGATSEGRNTSLTHERAELLRRFTLALGDRGTAEERSDVSRVVMRSLLASPRHPAEHSLPALPDWARDRVAEASRQQADAARTAGILVGDPDTLLVPPADGSQQLPADPGLVPLDVAVDALAALWAPGG